MPTNKSSQYLTTCLILLSLVLLIGTTGYIVIEGWPILDAFYMTIITITTVGFTETHPLSDLGRVFTIALILCGWTTFAIAGALIARVVIQKEIKGFFRRNSMQNIIDKMKHHYIICGGGRMGSFVCEDLRQSNTPFVLVEIDETLLQLAEKKGYLVIKGNATTDETLKEAGVERAKGLVAALTHDADNLLISLAARELNPNIHIIARCEKTSIHKRMKQGGSDVVVSPLQLGAKHITNLIAGQL